jgi:hypothetical protein
MGALGLTTGGVLYMHSYQGGEMLGLFSFAVILVVMIV